LTLIPGFPGTKQAEMKAYVLIYKDDTVSSAVPQFGASQRVHECHVSTFEKMYIQNNELLKFMWDLRLLQR
jgi:hypothetical protein